MSDQHPAICESCLSRDSKFIRMTKAPDGATCKICTLPFTLFYFKLPGHRHLTKTLICLNCSKQRNICQCCLLDLTWHVPTNVRDQILSMLNDSAVVTEEASNEMVKRFIGLKDGDSFKMGGASVTSDYDSNQQVMLKLQNILNASTSQGTSTATAGETDPLNGVATLATKDKHDKREKYANLDISHILKRLPLKGSIEKDDSTRSFFLYNIDPGIPEWSIVEKVSSMVETTQWQDRETTSVIINHTAKCGGIRFKSADLANRFITQLEKNGSKGVLAVRNCRIHVVKWSSMHSGAFGDKYAEFVKLGLSLDKLVQKDVSPSTTKKESPVTIKSKKKDTQATGKVQKIGILRDKKKKRRVLDIEL